MCMLIFVVVDFMDFTKVTKVTYTLSQSELEAGGVQIQDTWKYPHILVCPTNSAIWLGCKLFLVSSRKGTKQKC